MLPFLTNQTKLSLLNQLQSERVHFGKILSTITERKDGKMIILGLVG